MKYFHVHQLHMRLHADDGMKHPDGWKRLEKLAPDIAAHLYPDVIFHLAEEIPLELHHLDP